MRTKKKHMWHLTRREVGVLAVILVAGVASVVGIENVESHISNADSIGLSSTNPNAFSPTGYDCILHGATFCDGFQAEKVGVLNGQTTGGAEGANGGWQVEKITGPAGAPIQRVVQTADIPDARIYYSTPFQNQARVVGAFTLPELPLEQNYIGSNDTHQITSTRQGVMLMEQKTQIGADAYLAYVDFTAGSPSLVIAKMVGGNIQLLAVEGEGDAANIAMWYHNPTGKQPVIIPSSIPVSMTPGPEVAFDFAAKLEADGMHLSFQDSGATDPFRIFDQFSVVDSTNPLTSGYAGIYAGNKGVTVNNVSYFNNADQSVPAEIGDNMPPVPTPSLGLKYAPVITYPPNSSQPTVPWLDPKNQTTYPTYPDYLHVLFGIGKGSVYSTQLTGGGSSTAPCLAYTSFSAAKGLDAGFYFDSGDQSDFYSDVNGGTALSNNGLSSLLQAELFPSGPDEEVNGFPVDYTNPGIGTKKIGLDQPVYIGILSSCGGVLGTGEYSTRNFTPLTPDGTISFANVTEYQTSMRRIYQALGSMNFVKSTSNYEQLLGMTPLSAFSSALTRIY